MAEITLWLCMIVVGIAGLFIGHAISPVWYASGIGSIAGLIVGALIFFAGYWFSHR